MLVRFRCKDCGQKYQVPDNYATGEFRCVECNGEMEIPENSTLNDRPPVDFGNNDVRPLIDIPVNMKLPHAGNTLKSEKELIEDKIESEVAPESEPEIEIEPEIAFESEPEIEIEPEVIAEETNIKPDVPVSKLKLQPEKLTLSPISTVAEKLPSTSDSPLKIMPSSSRKIVPPPASKKIAPPPLPASKVVEFVPGQPKSPDASIVLPGSQSCANHPHLKTTLSCNSCHSPICIECRKEWGYFCSAACRDASLSTVDRKIKMDQAKENAKLDWVIKGIKIFLLIIVCIIIGYIGIWAWYQFLDPGGKVAWQWKHPVASINYLSIKPDRLVLLADEDIITLDTQTGKVISSFNSKTLSECPYLQKKIEDKILVSGEKEIALVGLNAKTLWKSSFDDPIIEIVVGTEMALVTTRRWVKSNKMRRTRYGRVMLPPTPVTNRYALDIKQGKKLSGKKVDSKGYLNIVAVKQQNYISIATTYLNNQSKTVLQLNRVRDNKNLWRIPLPGPLTMGPLIYKDNVIFRINDSLNAVSIAGKKIWKAEVQGRSLNRNFEQNDGLAFFSSTTMLTVFDMNAGKILWSKPRSVERISYIAGKLFIRVSEEDKEYGKTDMKVKLPPAYEKLKKEEPVIKAMFENKNKRVKYDDFIICLDARSGKRLWKSDKILGQLIVGFDRAVIFRDTAGTSIFSAVSTNSDGKSVIGQLDLQTGKWLFDRNDDIGIAGKLIIAGDKCIGLIYDRNAGQSTKNMQYPGLAAFNLK